MLCYITCYLLILLIAPQAIMAENNIPTFVPDPSMTESTIYSEDSNTNPFNNTVTSSFGLGSTSISDPLPSSTPQASRKVCPRNIDDVIGYVWPLTLQSTFANHSCPSPFTGQVKRFCTKNGNWLKPSFTNCQATSIEGLYEVLNSILSNLNESSEDALYFIQQLKNLTTQTFTAVGVDSGPDIGGTRPSLPAPLSSDDLRTVNLVCRSTLRLIGTDTNTVADMFDLFSNALDLRNTGSWKELQERDLGSEELLNSAEMYAGLAANGISQPGEVIRISRQNIAIKAMQVPVNDGSTDPVFPMPGDVANTTIPDDSFKCKMRLPSKYLQAVAKDTDAVSTAFVLFPTLQNFLPGYILPENVSVGSVILSAQVVGESGNESPTIDPLSTDPIEMNFTMQVPFNDGQTTVTCVYWNFTERFRENSTSSGSWLSDGIVTEVIDNNTVRCLSSHLTNFAVLLDISGASDTSEDTTPLLHAYGNQALYSISFAGSCLSILCLGFTIIFLLSLGKEIFEKVHYLVHLNLCISLFIGLITFISALEYAVPYPILCRVVAASLHYFFLSAFCWMLCEAIMVFLMIVVVFTTLHKKWYLFLVIGWVPPLVIVVITFSAFYDDYIGEADICWLNDSNYIVWSFSGPLLLILLVNLFVMIAVFVEIYRSKKRLRKMSVKGTGGTLKGNSMRKEENPYRNMKKTVISMIRGVIVLLPLLGVTWIGGFFSLNEKTFIVACIFGMLNSFQGVFIFVFHVLLSQKAITWFRKIISKYHKKSSSQTDISLVGSRRKLQTIASTVSAE